MRNKESKDSLFLWPQLTVGDKIELCCRILPSLFLEIGEDPLTDITLETALEPGQYECIMEHHLLDPGTSQEVDGLDLYLTINVKDVEAN